MANGKPPKRTSDSPHALRRTGSHGFKPPTPEVSERMRRVRSRGTGLERRMEGLLRDLGLRFERQPDLAGRPDFRLTGTRVLLFCDSSFWHGGHAEDRSASRFRRNRAAWVQKLEANCRRDRRVSARLRRAGWSVQRFWDDDVLHKPDKVKNKLMRVLDVRR